MFKHRLSPTPLPAAKRKHTSTAPKTTSVPLLNFDSSLYDELVLVIFSHLSWVDLCVIQPTNRHWARLATDNQLWKKLFIQEHGRLRLRGSRGFVSRNDGREVKPLPLRSKWDDHIDWKWMFRICLNWRRGRCVLEQLNEPFLGDQIAESTHPACLVIAGSLIVTTSSVPSPSPAIYIHQQGHSPYILKGRHRTDSLTQLTCLALDQSPPTVVDHPLRLAAFYDTGEFSIFLVDHSSPQHSRRLVSYQPIKTERTSPIRQAAYHHPLLVTLSHSFRLSLYNLSDDTIVHTQTLSSFTSFPPTSMVLTPGPNNYRLVLAYSAPVYPAHWGAAVTVLTVSACQSSPHNGTPLSSTEDIADVDEPCTVVATRTVRSHDVPMGWIDDRALLSIREQWGRKVARVADTQTDGKWVVLAPADRLPLHTSAQVGASIGTTSCALQLYKLQFPSSAASGMHSHTSAPKMTFVRTLLGHTGPVIALALADGRCVSLGADGSLWVWDLEKDWGVEVQAAHRKVVFPIGGNLVGEVPMGTPQGALVFDERRIVSADAHGIEARRFDI